MTLDPKATHRHVKRGTDYALIAIATWVSIDPAKDDDDAYVAEVAPGIWHARWAFAPQDPKAEWARVQTAEPFGVGTLVAVYRSIADGSLWIRPREEFEDGRFEALASRPSAIVEEPLPQRWHDVDYLMSIIDSAIEDGFDPDEDGPLLDEIRAELKAIPPSPQPHTGRAGVTEATVEQVEMVEETDGFMRPSDPIWRICLDGYCADFESEVAASNFCDAINRLAALTVEPEAGEVMVKPLEWQRENVDGTFWIGYAPVAGFGEYRVKFNGEDWEAIRGMVRICTVPSSDEAKAAAQADYTARIRSALAP